MKAALLVATCQPLVVADVPTPEPGPDEVLLETRACGVCRTDIHIQDGLAYVPKLPHIPGHEAAGVIAAVGSNVRDWKIGQPAMAHLFVRSRDCWHTRRGADAQATHLEGILGVTLPGGFAEYFRAPARNLLALPAGVPFEFGGLASCAAITAVHALERSRVGPGETAVVLGPGGIGLMLIQLLVAAGVRVAAVGQGEESLAAARAAGASLAFAADRPDAEDRIRALAPETEGVDAVFELVGRAATMGLAARLARRGGRIIVIGEEAEFPAINTIQLAQRELELIGSRNGGRADGARALELMTAGVLRPVIAARFPLGKINEALDLVRSGRAVGRVVIKVKD